MSRHGIACCPAHNDRTPSLSITPGHSAVLFHCFAGCERAAIIDALKASKIGQGAKAIESKNWVEPIKLDYKWLANKIWSQAGPVANTPAACYLEQRAIEISSRFCRYVDKALTYENEEKIFLPALLIPVTNDLELVAIQRIFLDRATGGKAILPSNDPKKLLGFPAMGAIRYGNFRGNNLNLAEGFEDAVSVCELFGLAHCWSACGIERYQHVAIPECVRTVTIWSQHGPEAVKALAKATPYLTANNRQLDIKLPTIAGDWNDMLRQRKALA